jgi:hypothetical protein
MGGIYEACNPNEIRYHDIVRMKFDKDWFRHSEVERWDTKTYRHINVIS